MNTGLSTAERLAVEATLEHAFGPLRAAGTDLSPLRVRAAVRWGRGQPPGQMRWARVVARVSEMSVAVGMTALVFVGAFGSAPLPAADTTTSAPPAARDESIYPVPRVSAPASDERYIRWLRIDRYIPLQDWLEPTYVRLSDAPALVQPAPRSDPGPF